MVTQDKTCDAIVAPAATDVSFPYALGMIIGLSPKGIAKETMMHTIVVFIISAGIIISNGNT